MILLDQNLMLHLIAKLMHDRSQASVLMFFHQNSAELEGEQPRFGLPG
jgi:hypothetical protein